MMRSIIECSLTVLGWELLLNDGKYYRVRPNNRIMGSIRLHYVNRMMGNIIKYSLIIE